MLITSKTSTVHWKNYSEGFLSAFPPFRSPIKSVLSHMFLFVLNDRFLRGIFLPFRLTFNNHAAYIYRTGESYPQMLHFIYIFSTNISTEYFKHAAHFPFFSSKCLLFHNATFFGSCIIHILHTGVLKFKCKTPVPKG